MIKWVCKYCKQIDTGVLENGVFICADCETDEKEVKRLRAKIKQLNETVEDLEQEVKMQDAMLEDHEAEIERLHGKLFKPRVKSDALKGASLRDLGVCEDCNTKDTKIKQLQRLVHRTYYEAYADARSFSDKCALDMWPFSNARAALREDE